MEYSSIYVSYKNRVLAQGISHFDFWEVPYKKNEKESEESCSCEV